MAKSSQPAVPVAANLSVQQMRAAIPKIDRRLAELESFDPNSVNDRKDPKIDSIEQKIDDLLVDIFGNNTIEYKRYKYKATNLDTAQYYMNGTPLAKVHEGLIAGKANAISVLNTIKDLFIEKMESDGPESGVKRTLRAYEGLELHPEIERAAGQLFKDGHYSNAIEDAVKALNNFVRMRSGLDQDGATLMERAFSPKNPVLKFNSLADASDIEEQKGFMMMFSGAVSGLRNPRAHRLMKDDPERALEFIAFISLLAKLVDL